MKFERWRCQEGRSVSFRLFERDHTQINEIYWCSVSEKGFFDHIYRNTKKQKVPETPHQILKINELHKGSKNIRNVLPEWDYQRKNMSLWIRMNTLLSLNSYFELYLNRITHLAQESNPGLFLGADKVVDGAHILKTNDWNDAYLPNYGAEVTKGTWSQRLAALEKIFGIRLPMARAEELKLDKNRILRNKIAHYYGKDIDDLSILNFESQRPASLTEVTLLAYMKLIYDVAEEVDGQMIQHIGDFEIVRFYHALAKLGKGMDKKELKKIINEQELWMNKGVEYCDGLIKYYQSL